MKLDNNFIILKFATQSNPLSLLHSTRECGVYLIKYVHKKRDKNILPPFPHNSQYSFSACSIAVASSRRR